MTNILAQRVLLERRTLNWNQDELASKAGVSRSYISHIERAQIPNPTIDVVESLAVALGVRPEYLLGWVDTPIDDNLAQNVGYNRVVYQAVDADESERIQKLLDGFSDLAPDYQAMALHMIEEFRRVQNVRIVGGE